MDTIQAAVLRSADGPYSIEPVTLDDPGPTQVVIRVRAAGYCHSDVLPRAEGFPQQPPLITGHEGAGVVEWVGSEVTDVSIGDHVVLSFAHCGTCARCANGHPAYCPHFMELNVLGGTDHGGAGAVDSSGAPLSARWFGQSSFATKAVVDAANVVVVDQDLPFELIAPLGCGVITGAGSVVNCLKVSDGDSFVVFGVGSVGLAALMAAKDAGADPVIAVDLHRSRLDLAAELGATATLAGDDADILEQIRSLTSGGSDYAFDTTGVPSVLLLALQTLRWGGSLGTVGVQTGDLVLDPVALNGKTITSIIEGDAHPRTFIHYLLERWRAGRFPLERLITTFDFEQINEAERCSLNGEVIKPVLVMPE